MKKKIIFEFMNLRVFEKLKGRHKLLAFMFLFLFICWKIWEYQLVERKGGDHIFSKKRVKIHKILKTFLNS